MAIKKRFNGKTIRHPGAYSRAKTDNTAGSPTIATDIMMLVGESTLGAPGSVTGVTEFAAERLSDLIATYGSGPLVDSALAARTPSKQSSGPSTFLVYKTNQSGQANAMIKKSTDNIFQVKDSAYGLPGNDLSVIVASGDTGNQKLISVAKLGDTTEALGQNPAQQVLNIRYIGNGTTATMTIAGASQDAKTLVSTLAGDQTDGSVALSIILKNYTMKTLVDYINAQVGYSANLLTTSLAPTKANELDPVTATNIKPALVVQYRLQREILDVINSSSRIEGVIQAQSVVGLPDNGTTSLSGGSQGASTNSNFASGFTASFAEDYSVLVPCVSRDASEDIADSKQGFTDASSTYTIAAVLAAQDAHLLLRGDTKNRKEAQGFAGVRKSTKDAAFALISSLGSERMQVCMQDVLTTDAANELRYMHPHVAAAMAAGLRCGQEIGEPITFKYANVLDVGHFVDPDTGLSAGDFNPGLDYDAAIDAGALCLEKAKGGWRWIVDNTTYGADENFVYNRGSVMSAANYVQKVIRETAENAFVGKKLANGGASSIKEMVRNKLRELNAPDVNIITSSSDAPEGYVEETFTVTITGNTCYVAVEFKPVQGLDFIFFDFTLGDIKQSA